MRALRPVFCGLFLAIAAFSLNPLASSPAMAQSIMQGGLIEEIRIEGAQRIDPQTVRSYMLVDPGDQFDPLRLDESLKAIFDTGLFADVTLRREGNTLVVDVVENPIINRIAFEGNDAIEDGELEGEVELRPRVVYTRTRVQNDVQRMLDLYRRNGRFAARVEPKIIELPQNRVDLVFEINEGEVTGIKSVNFIGNRAFSDGSLRSEISTTESAWYRFLSTDDTYDPDRLNFDRELLRRFYLSEGYADFRVLSVVAELDDDRSGFIVTFTMDEGPRYDFGEVDLTTTLKDLNVEQLRGELQAEPGDVYDATAVEADVDTLTDVVGNLGYAFVDIRPRTRRDRENLTIGITYDIQEGPKVFVERIDIQGNTRTLDRVIRREFRLVEGDAFNASKLRRSRQRIENLGFFRSVNVQQEPGSAPDRSVMKVEVEEQSTGEITIGAGISTSAGPLGNIQLRERNLLGRGQDLRLGFTLSGSSSQIDLSFTEPYFLDRPIAAGFDVFRVTREFEESDFDQQRIGFGLRAGYDLTEHTRHVVRYRLERQEISDVDDDASILIRSEEGDTLRSIVGQDLTWDRRDNRFDTREGYRLRLSNEVAGLGGDVSFLRNTLEGDYYVPVLESMTLRFGGEFGYMFGIGEDTRIADRFFIGGETFRGFEPGGAGPRDVEADDALGGNTYYKGTVELSFPLGLPEEFEIRGRLFTDIGASFDADSDEDFVENSAAPRVSVGPGISWRSPFGPLRLDIGFPIVKEDFDEEQLLSFSFGTQF
ncbi:outer membrane protein assembly factor BamA [Algihabitans albus]|uniref:outer membrane protein assembly factor BamA n=1 Tax=Algihabitans albus TaxID=2164067 RepID=UPI001F48C34C|nr:outer membrane protein assembly factor BamA [Algihabitans albus]